jgi:hypothetical protein
MTSHKISVNTRILNSGASTSSSVPVAQQATNIVIIINETQKNGINYKYTGNLNE